MCFRSLDDADVKGKRVLVRVDFNVPMNDGELSDTTRIERTAPTIREIADRGSKVILLSHFGRPKGRDPRISLKRVAVAAARIIGRPIAFADDCIGAVAEAAVNSMKPGDVLCLEKSLGDRGNLTTCSRVALCAGHYDRFHEVYDLRGLAEDPDLPR